MSDREAVQKQFRASYTALALDIETALVANPDRARVLMIAHEKIQQAMLIVELALAVRILPDRVLRPECGPWKVEGSTAQPMLRLQDSPMYAQCMACGAVPGRGQPCRGKIPDGFVAITNTVGVMTP